MLINVTPGNKKPKWESIKLTILVTIRRLTDIHGRESVLLIHDENKECVSIRCLYDRLCHDVRRRRLQCGASYCEGTTYFAKMTRRTNISLCNERSATLASNEWTVGDFTVLKGSSADVDNKYYPDLDIEGMLIAILTNPVIKLAGKSVSHYSTSVYRRISSTLCPSVHCWTMHIIHPCK